MNSDMGYTNVSWNRTADTRGCETLASSPSSEGINDMTCVQDRGETRENGRRPPAGPPHAAKQAAPGRAAAVSLT
ncbi:unnamed protein product [Lota lota]